MQIDTAPVPAPRRTLAEMAEDVRSARAQVVAHRRQPVDQPGLASARLELLRTMELYAGELAARRLPVPPQLRDDLRLHRHLGGNPARS